METYPTALEQPEPRVLAYSRETVIAEKREALVSLGTRNSRMKDFYDLHFLAANYKFSGRVLSQAIRARFERRKTPTPDVTPFGLTEEFATAPDRVTQWSALIRRRRLKRQASVSQLLVVLRALLVPILDLGQRMPRRQSANRVARQACVASLIDFKCIPRPDFRVANHQVVVDFRARQPDPFVLLRLDG